MTETDAPQGAQLAVEWLARKSKQWRRLCVQDSARAARAAIAAIQQRQKWARQVKWRVVTLG